MDPHTNPTPNPAPNPAPNPVQAPGPNPGETSPTGGARAPRDSRCGASGDALLARARELLREGNARRIVIGRADRRPLLEIPLTLGLVVCLLLPLWTALAALLALATDFTLRVERRDAAPHPPRHEPRQAPEPRS